MDYFGTGPLEILLILLIGFLIFGPRSLFEMSRKAGRALRSLERNASDLSTRLEGEFEEKGLEKPTPGKIEGTENR